jgi:hypothetical protein
VIKRYKIYAFSDGNCPIEPGSEESFEDADGGWVHYEDIKHLLPADQPSDYITQWANTPERQALLDAERNRLADQQSAAPQAIKGKSFDQFRDECREYAKQQSLPESGTSVPNTETRAAMEEARGFIQLLLPRCPNCQQPQGHGGPCSTTDKSKGDL